MTDKPNAEPAETQEDPLAQSRKAWLKKRKERLEETKAAAAKSHASALDEMKKPKKERM